MTIDSLRGYLDTLEETSDIVRIDEPVSWDLEASAVTMRANLEDGPIPLFETITDSRIPGARLLGDPYRGSANRPWDRLARGLGIDPGQSAREYYETIIERLQSARAPVEISGSDAPCKAVIRGGNDRSLLDIPWPYIHEGDGGRYSNLHTLIAPDRDSDWIDWSYHRAMIHDADTASLLLLAGEQIPNFFYYNYERVDEPMPVALAIGPGPAVQAASVMWIPTGRDEAEFASGLAGEPVELTRCETNDLLVPANAELIVEGRVIPGDRRDEGPFGDYFGYMHGPRRSMPTLKVDAITHRERPIIPFCVEGTGVGNSENTTSSLEVAAVGPDATLGLRAAGFDVDACAPWPTTPRTVYTVATDVPYPGYLHEIANFIYTTWGMLHVDCFVFVDPDVDPLDTKAVLRAIGRYADPEEDFHQFDQEKMPKVPLNIYQTPTEKGDVPTGTSKTTTTKTYIDATGDPNRSTPIDDEVRERARAILADAGVNRTKSPWIERGGEGR